MEAHPREVTTPGPHGVVVQRAGVSVLQVGDHQQLSVVGAGG